MRFKGLDLNLLVALDILLTEKNVSRAADKLCLSQSATSGALARLRDYFGDDLLVQVGRKMVLTPRAMALSAKVRAALMQIDGTIIQPPDFDPATVKRELTIVASDYVVIAQLSKALREIGRKAPGLKLRINPPGLHPRENLERGDVDLMAMPEVYLSPDHPSEWYFNDDYVVVAWEKNTQCGETITEEEFYACGHVTMQFATHTPSFETWFMENQGAERRIAAISGSFTALPFMLEGTNNVALLQRKLADTYAAFLPLKVMESPVKIPPLVEQLQWHKFSETDECLTWVRNEILAARDTSV
ncbi:MAG: LysR family transcriptional regulator [Maritimibacter sp.]